MIRPKRSVMALANEKKVKEALKELEKATKYEIAKKLKISDSTVNDALNRMLLKNKVNFEYVKENRNSRGRPKTKWFLVNA